MNDLGKDVLFDLITREHGTKAAGYFDRNVAPRVAKLIARLEKLEAQTAAEPAVQAVFVETSWGGTKGSGIGRELGPWGLSGYLSVKHVTRCLG